MLYSFHKRALHVHMNTAADSSMRKTNDSRRLFKKNHSIVFPANVCLKAIE